jgi:hypothetical protein
MRIALTTRSRARGTAAALLLCGAVLGAGAAAAQDKIPADFQGDWVPAKSDCQSPARFRVTETGMTLVNGKDSQSYGDVGIAYSFLGPDYQGIIVVALPEVNSGETPFTVYFNADEKKGVTTLDIYSEMQGVTNAQVMAIQAANKKLAERFPLNKLPLKKCPAK